MNYGENHHSWKRGWAYSSDGAIFIHENGTQVYEHRKIATEVLGKELPTNSVVHHADGDPTNNSNNNLVICENNYYHRFLHMRKKAYDACGHADWLKCKYCKQYDDPKYIHIVKHPDRERTYHKECHNKYQLEWRNKKNDTTNPETKDEA